MNDLKARCPDDDTLTRAKGAPTASKLPQQLFWFLLCCLKCFSRRWSTSYGEGGARRRADSDSPEVPGGGGGTKKSNNTEVLLTWPPHCVNLDRIHEGGTKNHLRCSAKVTGGLFNLRETLGAILKFYFRIWTEVSEMSRDRSGLAKTSEQTTPTANKHQPEQHQL